jgi:hypothetical protein
MPVVTDRDQPYYYSLYSTIRAAEGTEPESEWQAWKERMWDQLVHQFYPDHGLCAQEQYTRRSQRERRCIECGEPGTVKQESVLIKAVSHYYLCDACNAYWEAKG